MIEYIRFKEKSFFLIGAPKCGTTSLAKHLSDHPEISFSKPKEPHFFSSDYPFGPPGLRDLEDYLSIFPTRPTTKCFGEGSILYLYSKDAIQRIEELTDGRARYIVCLRNPVKASVSLHAQHVAFGWEPERDYLTALRRPPCQSANANSNPKLVSILDYAYFYRYSPHIHRLLEAVNRDRIFFCVAERDGRNPQIMYDQLHQFLAVAQREVNHSERFNEARRIENDILYRLLTSPFFLSAAKAARRTIAPNGFGFKRPTRVISQTEVEIARSVFKNDILLTAELVKFDPRLWNYAKT